MKSNQSLEHLFRSAPLSAAATDSESEAEPGDYLPQTVEFGGFGICQQGECELAIDQKCYRIRRGDLCIVFPRVTLQIISRSADLQGHSVLADVDRLQKNPPLASAPPVSFLLRIRENPCITLSEERFRRMVRYFEQIEEIERAGVGYAAEIVRMLHTILFYEIMDAYRQGEPLSMQPQSRQNELFRRFATELSRHYTAQREIGFYADLLCVTPKYLSTVIRATTGYGAAWWIAQTVIHHAKNKLIYSAATIQQISNELNFPNPSFFGQYFKRHTGMTPKEFRLREIR